MRIAVLGVAFTEKVIVKKTIVVRGSSIEAGHVVVGLTGALMPVKRVSSSTRPGMLVMETEYGAMFFSPDEEFQVVDNSPEE